VDRAQLGTGAVARPSYPSAGGRPQSMKQHTVRPERAARHRDVPRRRRWRRFGQKPRFLPGAPSPKQRWAGQDARIQRFILGVPARSPVEGHKVAVELRPAIPEHEPVVAQLGQRLQIECSGQHRIALFPGLFDLGAQRIRNE
jgi:hypothetical protein